MEDEGSPDSSGGQQEEQAVKRKRITQAGAKKRGPRAGYIESLENRLKEMEALLKPLQNDPAVGGSLQSGMKMEGMGDTDGKRRKKGKRPDAKSPSGGSGSSSDNDGDSDGGSALDDEMRGSASGGGPSQQGFFNTYPANAAAQAPPLPQEAATELVDLFFHYIYPVLPVVHKHTFVRAYANESPLLLNAMYALAARYSTHPTVRTNPAALFSAGDVFYVRARELVDHYMDVPSATTVSALLALAMYAAGSGRGSAAWMYSGMAIRMAQELKLNVEPEFEEAYAASGRLSWLEKETRRRLWWGCFVLDRYAGAAADRSMIINEKDCKVYLPSNESSWDSVQNAEDEPAGAVGPSDSFQIAVLTSTNTFTPGIPLQNPMGYFILLTKIFGKIVEYSNQFKNHQRTNPNATSNPDADYQLSILDASLRDWFASLPHWMRQIGDEFVWDMASTSAPSWHTAYLHIFYHTCVILLHRPKMMAGLRDCPPTVQFSPSFMLCHTSAQEISQIIGKVALTNPCFHYFSPFVGFCVFQSGLIHVMAAQVASDQAVVQTAQRNVENHVGALQGIAKYWFMAGRLHAVLKNLIESARAPVGQGMSWLMLKEKMDASMSEDAMEGRPDGPSTSMADVMSPNSNGAGPIVGGPSGSAPPMMQGHTRDGEGDVPILDYELFADGQQHPGGWGNRPPQGGPYSQRPPGPGPSQGSPQQPHSPYSQQMQGPPAQGPGYGARPMQMYGGPPQVYSGQEYPPGPPGPYSQHSMPPPYPNNRQLPLPHANMPPNMSPNMQHPSQHPGHPSQQHPGMPKGPNTPGGMPDGAPSPLNMGTPAAMSPLFPNLDGGRWE
ncbi:hypothetical protein SmJEL517_g04685 [Synchytrium microbalum]|uniref:Xylanolytic transcriptional activator regulatory domain-containing protein n=1 Tax=Synchytrium microbalum TaxID=1806994 RepID=A0A507C2C7_9FUNG|nr:uncharacterized protein SmJEL517_g04685 [Synchytrium microbalum]TPX32106.1 hypothetical protein SmJEL517_g04685 [Synchytrium microbalum]